MTRLRLLLSRLTAPEADEPAPARRSRRDWIVDSALFLLAAVFGATAGLSSARHGLHVPLLVVDAIGGAGLCPALWWRRRWPLSLGLGSLPVLAVSSSAGPACVIILYTVAAYRRWQLAALVAAGQVALLPVGRVLHPQGNSLAVYYLTSTLGTAVIVAWGMFRQGRRQSRWERTRDGAPEVIVLTTFEADDYVLRALRAGASGFLLKDTPPADIVRAVRTVAAGEPILSPTITRRLIGHVTDSDGDDRTRRAREQLDRLTQREREVAIAIGLGKSNAEIGRELYMSVATVKAHVSRLLEKLQFNNRVQIALLAHDAREA